MAPSELETYPPLAIWRELDSAAIRLFDVVASAVGLVVISPLMAVAAIAIWLDSPGGVFFRQERVGRGFKTFTIYKLRSMVAEAPSQGRPLTAGADPRITRVGRFFRSTKIDELPQLINVLLGDMSLVGPRPEVPKYVEMFRHEYAQILTVRPGITDPASIEFSDEATILGDSQDPELEYVARVLPRKLRLSQAYVANRSLFYNVTLIVRTVYKLFRRQ